jgi:hypothetical protein
MKLWSQLARLGAAVAALSPAIAEADDDPEQVEIPALDTNNQPVAAATIAATAVDPDANLIEDMSPVLTPYTAALPATVQLPPAPEERTPGPPRTRPKGSAKPHSDATPHGKSWYGGGQRYGG